MPWVEDRGPGTRRQQIPTRDFNLGDAFEAGLKNHKPRMNSDEPGSNAFAQGWDWGTQTVRQPGEMETHPLLAVSVVAIEAFRLSLKGGKPLWPDA
jgi:hypothetical protein